MLREYEQDAGTAVRSTHRSWLRHHVLSGLSAWQRSAAAITALSRTPRVQLLILHHVFRDEVAAFRQLVEQLSRRFDLVSYSRAVEVARTAGHERPCLAFSFDDGLKSCLTASRVLDEFGVSGCFFVCPPLIGEKDFGTISQFCRVRLKLPPVEFLSWDDVKGMISRGHEFGGHTMNHLDLGQVAESIAAEEIGACHDELRKRLGTVQHFAWPTGRFDNFTAQAGRAVFDAGFTSCAAGTRGCHQLPTSPVDARDICLRRDSLMAAWPWTHVAYFLAQAARAPLPASDTWPASWRDVVRGNRTREIRRAA